MRQIQIEIDFGDLLDKQCMQYKEKSDIPPWIIGLYFEKNTLNLEISIASLDHHKQLSTTATITVTNAFGQQIDNFKQKHSWICSNGQKSNIIKNWIPCYQWGRWLLAREKSNNFITFELVLSSCFVKPLNKLHVVSNININNHSTDNNIAGENSKNTEKSSKVLQRPKRNTKKEIQRDETKSNSNDVNTNVNIGLNANYDNNGNNKNENISEKKDKAKNTNENSSYQNLDKSSNVVNAGKQNKQPQQQVKQPKAKQKQKKNNYNTNEKR